MQAHHTQSIRLSNKMRVATDLVEVRAGQSLSESRRVIENTNHQDTKPQRRHQPRVLPWIQFAPSTASFHLQGRRHSEKKQSGECKNRNTIEFQSLSFNSSRKHQCFSKHVTHLSLESSTLPTKTRYTYDWGSSGQYHLDATTIIDMIDIN